MPHPVQLDISSLSWSKMICETVCPKWLLQLHRVKEVSSINCTTVTAPGEATPEQLYQVVLFKSSNIWSFSCQVMLSALLWLPSQELKRLTVVFKCYIDYKKSPWVIITGRLLMKRSCDWKILEGLSGYELNLNTSWIRNTHSGIFLCILLPSQIVTNLQISKSFLHVCLHVCKSLIWK